MLGVPIMSQHIYHELIMLVMCFHCLNSLKVQGRSELGPFSMFLIRGVLAIFYLFVFKNKKKEYIVKKKNVSVEHHARFNFSEIWRAVMMQRGKTFLGVWRNRLVI